MPPLPFVLLLAAAPQCDPAQGWQAGREGLAAARCEAGDYREAHRLGQALHELRQERAKLLQALPGTPAAQQGALQRRVRQLDVDLEAIRGVATIKGWPLDVAPEPVR
jgi:hypothetical protein